MVGCTRAVDPNHLLQTPTVPPNTLNGNVVGNGINGIAGGNLNGINGGMGGVCGNEVNGINGIAGGNLNGINGGMGGVCGNGVNGINGIAGGNLNGINGINGIAGGNINQPIANGANNLIGFDPLIGNNLLSQYPNIGSYDGVFIVNFFNRFSLRSTRRGTRIDIMNITRRVFERLSFVFIFVSPIGNIVFDYTTKTVARISPGQSTSFFVDYVIGNNRIILANVIGLMR